ncbi:MAG: 4-hydroxythreonine-4-phosphate dehydrogenase PdxA [Parasphingorhabdus sp.]|nr:4-hydroxythreonine-4-phosphate dehydrogenase PdxA [Parasphingorhabdus sp.]
MGLPLMPFAISSGDPAGIGPEIIAKSWLARSKSGLHPFFAVGDANVFAATTNAPIERIASPAAAQHVFADALPVLHVHDGEVVVPGKPSLDGAQSALYALEIAFGLTKSGEAGALVTGPVCKSQLQQIGFTYPGQTEFVSERCGIARENAVMMLAGPELRVIPMTTHVALSRVPELLTVSLVKARIVAAQKAMQRNFGIKNPRIMVAGVNPHAGEQGRMGREEIDVMAPAIAEARDEGIDVSGPASADSLFHADARAAYDVVLCAYHDQALIPLKTLHFFDGVNMTLGLPIVRTSPDHGTAFDIAGQDKADPRSMIAAIKMAEAASQHRQLDAA